MAGERKGESKLSSYRRFAYTAFAGEDLLSLAACWGVFKRWGGAHEDNVFDVVEGHLVHQRL